MELFKAELGIFVMIVLGVATYFAYRQLPYIKTKRIQRKWEKKLAKVPTEEERILNKVW